ncbi:MAG: peroxiredoxin [gamma proteobacterium symbiont of Bathyaustriella thionipta]|nr:peroxiredoxin [gamma proteobacterium symbiont of Bathyaustriella thionipta]
MPMVELNKKIPDLEITLSSNKPARLSDYQGRHLLLYFYPRASTPGCTTEGQNFRDQINKFRRQSCAILGASRDSVKAQARFREKQQFPFELVADTDETLCRLFDVIKMKNMYGKQVLGIERSTFLIDKEGVLRQVWRKVKVAGHVDEVLLAVKQLNQSLKQG